MINIAKKIFGDPNTRELNKIKPLVEKINKLEEVATAGVATNVLATKIANAAIIRTNVAQAKMRNNCFPLCPIYSSIILPMD